MVASANTAKKTASMAFLATAANQQRKKILKCGKKSYEIHRMHNLHTIGLFIKTLVPEDSMHVHDNYICQSSEKKGKILAKSVWVIKAQQACNKHA